MKILLSAAEASSDAHGAQLLEALKETAPPGESVEAFGAGGPKLAAAGQRQVVDTRQMLAMGIFAVLARLPKILSALSALSRAARREKPDLAVVIDYPDFHFRLAKKLRRFGIPAIYYIPPKVWAWRSGRVRFLARHFRRLLCILPFEEAFYRRFGVKAVFVGNPILDELPLSLTRAEARSRLGIAESETVLLLMPGSRPAELGAHFGVLLEAAERAARLLNQRLRVLVPLSAVAADGEGDRYVQNWKAGRSEAELSLQIRVSRGDAHLCMLAADAGVIKSGTSTLEAGVLGCPHVIIYRGSRIVNWMFKTFVRYEGPVGLVNLAVTDQPPERVDRLALPFRELVMENCEPDRISREIAGLFRDSERRERLREQCRRLRERMCGGDGARPSPSASPSRRAAREIWEIHRRNGSRASREQASGLGPRGPARLLNHAVSSVWSAINAGARLLTKLGVLRPARLPARVISVGNLQAGGTGKTPLVSLIAREALERGLSVCILSRGYRGEWEHQGGLILPEGPVPPARVCGDEARLLKDAVPQAWFGIGADRLRQYRRIVERMGKNPDLVILDDGFQNWKIRKDLEVVAVTSTPRGQRLFRDWNGAARNADLMVWTKGETLPDFDRLPDVRVRYEIEGPKWDRPVVLVTGVADGNSVRRTAELSGYRIVRQLSFPDHAAYAPSMVRDILSEADRVGALVAVTGKDWVKWRELIPADTQPQVIVLEPTVKFEEGRDAWCKTLWGS